VLYVTEGNIIEETIKILTYSTNESLILKILKFLKAIHLSGHDKMIP
jgi:hypothetical protein